MTIETSKSVSRFSVQHVLVLVGGLLVFVLLFLANKSHLESPDDAAMQEESAPAQADGHVDVQPDGNLASLLGILHAAPPSARVDSLREALVHAQPPEDRTILYQGIVEDYRTNGRIDYAAAYAGALADEQPEVRNLVVAGALFRNAVFLEHFQSDSLAFRRFSDEALRHLRKAESLDARNEDALLELGLAMVESKQGELSMEGILKIRTVTEINPKNTEALYRLGVFSMDTKQYDKAEGRFRQILELEPENLSAQLLLAMACKQLGKNAESDRILRALAAQPGDPAMAERANSILNHQP
jgi:Flp pilus assembly protein TadD